MIGESRVSRGGRRVETVETRHFNIVLTRTAPAASSAVSAHSVTEIRECTVMTCHPDSRTRRLSQSCRRPYAFLAPYRYGRARLERRGPVGRHGPRASTLPQQRRAAAGQRERRAERRAQAVLV